MRKAFLVVALIGSSFAGGAAVNGPGLAWVKGLIAPAAEALESLDEDEALADDAEIADPPAPRQASKPGRRRTGASTDPAPSSDARPAPVETRSSGPSPDAPAPAATSPAPAPAAPAQGLLGTLQAAITPAAAAPAARSAEPTVTTSATPGGLTPPKLEPPGTGAGANPRPDPVVTPAAVAPEAAARPAERAATPAPAGNGNASGWLPPSIGKALAGGAAPTTTTTAPAPRAAPGSDGWAEIQRRMTAHGVSRYWIEGDAAAGTVRFRCVVPLAGRAAVAQQFEGEGEDLHAAAAVTLRRIDLWKATEQQP